MSTAAHTKGPWAVEPSDGRWVVKRPGSSVIFMFRKTQALAQKAADEANERWRRDLVREAAPDMLAVIQRMLRDLTHDGPSAAIATLNTHGRAAVAKAEGRS